MNDFKKDRLLAAVEWVEWQSTLDIRKREWWQDTWGISLDVIRSLKEKNEWSEERFSANVYGAEAMRRPECGTAMCLAGRIAATDLVDLGYRVKYSKTSGDMILFGPEGKNDFRDIADEVSDYLGIPIEEADELFDEINTAEDIRRIAEQIIRRREGAHV